MKALVGAVLVCATPAAAVSLDTPLHEQPTIRTEMAGAETIAARCAIENASNATAFVKCMEAARSFALHTRIDAAPFDAGITCEEAIQLPKWPRPNSEAERNYVSDTEALNAKYCRIFLIQLGITYGQMLSADPSATKVTQDVRNKLAAAFGHDEMKSKSHKP